MTRKCHIRSGFCHMCSNWVVIPFYTTWEKKNMCCATWRHAIPGTCHKFSLGGVSPVPAHLNFLLRSKKWGNFPTHPSSLLSPASLFGWQTQLCCLISVRCHVVKYCIWCMLLSRPKFYNPGAILYLLPICMKSDQINWVGHLPMSTTNQDMVHIPFRLWRCREKSNLVQLNKWVIWLDCYLTLISEV